MILVVGGTGDLGGRIVRLLREQGVGVRCLVRHQVDDSTLRQLGVDVARGDLTEPDSLGAACDGVDSVIATATAIARRFEDASTPTIKEVDEAGMASMVGAAESAGVEHFVYFSFPGVDRAVGTPLERAKLAIEERLRRGSLRPVIIRADAFQEIHLTAAARFDVAAGKVAIIGRGDSKRRWISTADVAALTASLAVEPDPPELVTVGGPEAISKNEAVAIVEEVTGRRLKVQHMPRAVARLAIRLLPQGKDALASAFGAGLLQDLQPATWDDGPLRQRGIDPKPASDFLREQARGTT
ncbi:SDR family oxidoreductase [Nocardioides bizhenqiangii]|uniref:NmrA family NAD(P)-binding protein n=1 Tax=Nocardioides bizhenqiangii TaxID=3095076 RepID=A0ABZ0ZUC7_9ACTN|nr:MULTISPECIES: NmrA family NAD(P)-binding protein [unclassified Nocardioides]MDZ5621783.1 NmrA family NAD(P)-binding protein [Nocardioides sp. HM23]WQQ27531.1 NmrA family NAD(P)-binding protein [Nocardioides sp. HM61]